MAPEIRTVTADEMRAVFDIRGQAFNLPPGRFERVAVHVRAQDTLAAFDAGRMVGCASVLALGQFFGGRSVKMGGLAGVAVVPERRGTGVGRGLIAAALETMRGRGEVISTLYPATTAAYRKSGWEVGGYRVRRRVPLRSLASLPDPAPDVSVRPFTDRDHAGVAASYRRVAAATDGFVDRDGGWWTRRLDDLRSGDHAYLYVAERDGEVVGHLAYHHSQRTGDDEFVGMTVDELVAGDRDAVLALWRTVASNRSVTARVTYHGGADDPLLLLLGEQDTSVVGDWRWMTRLVDAAGAVAARGFPAHVTGAVHLELADPHAGWNAGRYVLEVGGGQGKLVPGGDGKVRLGAGAFAALYTGYAAPGLLARHGLLDGAGRDDLDLMTAAFAGPPPWMVEFF